MPNVPHPFAHREILQCKVLRPFKGQKEQIEGSAQPVELGLINVGTITSAALLDRGDW